MGLKKAIYGISSNKGLRGFSLLYIPFLVIGLGLIIALKHGDIVLFINKYSRDEWDAFINFVSDLGLGGFLVVVVILLSFARIRYAVMGLFNLGLVGILTSFFKNTLFPDRLRPFDFFYYDDFSRFIYSAELNYFKSFPSGHTMAIFATMSLLAYFTSKHRYGMLFFCIALFIGFTRIYLCQHFFLDVYVGSILGIVSTLLTIWVGDHLCVLNQRSLFQKSIIKIFRRTQD